MGAVRVGSIDIAYREVGGGDPVLLINGTGETGSTWLPLVEPLSGRWRFLAIDQRDTGASSSVDAPYTPADLAVDALGVLDGLGIERAHVAGYSLGGAVAQEMAIAAPSRIRSLALLSTWARSDGWFVSQMRSWQSLRRAHLEDDAAFLRALEPWLFSPATFRDRDVYERIWAMWREEDEQSADGFLRQCDADAAHDAAERLRGLEVDALVIVGADDICTPPRYAAELCDLLPRARLVTVPDAGHCALFERPDVVRDALAALWGQA